MLDVRRLRVLCAVADEGSLSAAASALSYTPSAVSQQIVALEREIGARVLHRGPRGVRLTATGQLLVDHARPILAGLKAAESSVAAVTGLTAGRLRLASFATAGATLLPRAISEFRVRHPDVAITLNQADPEEAMARLRQGDVDLVITADVEPRPHDAIELIELMEDPLHAVLPASHPLAARPVIGLEELAADTWADPPAASEARALLLWACGQAGFIPRVAFESDEYTTVVQLVAAGVAVALVPAMALPASRAGIAVVPLRTPVVRRVLAGVHAAEFRSPAAVAMVEILRSVAESGHVDAPPTRAPAPIGAVLRA